ncbi:hypothetical protein LTR85_004892 [Meristemomyces frigidus]|nr:hypothetical protein LTR85_004892 [Meristemomyces frigidus]
MPHSTSPARSLTKEEFPIIDFRTVDEDPKAVAAEILDAAQNWGFLVLKGHGVPQEDVDHMFATSSSFFNEPKEAKSEKWMNTKQQGYDYKESVFGCTEGMCFGSIADANLTCDNLPSWWNSERRQEAEAFRSKCNELSTKLLKVFALAMGLDQEHFATAHMSGKEPGNVLRLIRYPVLTDPVDPSFPRLGEHTDWGTLTLLFTNSPGLEVQRPGGDGWVPAPVIEDAVIVNIADGLALWTGGLLKSTKHRLSWESLPMNQSRHSIAYFVNADADAPLRVLRKEEGSDSYSESSQSFDATFGDYQAVRMRIIHEKFDTDGTDDELKLDPKFVNLVRNIGVAHGTGVTFEGAHSTEVVA